MCLAAPVRIVEISGDGTAIVDKEGVRFSVSAALFPGLSRGDYVLVHAGFIIQRIGKEDAEERLEMISDLYGSEDQ